MTSRIQARADEFASAVAGRVSATFAQQGITMTVPSPLTVDEIARMAERLHVDPRGWFPRLSG